MWGRERTTVYKMKPSGSGMGRNEIEVTRLCVVCVSSTELWLAPSSSLSLSLPLPFHLCTQLVSEKESRCTHFTSADFASASSIAACSDHKHSVRFSLALAFACGLLRFALCSVSAALGFSLLFASLSVARMSFLMRLRLLVQPWLWNGFRVAREVFFFLFALVESPFRLLECCGFRRAVAVRNLALDCGSFWLSLKLNWVAFRYILDIFVMILFAFLHVPWMFARKIGSSLEK